MTARKNEKKAKNRRNILEFQKDVNYYFEKGIKYYLKNNLEKSKLYFNKTVEVEPENPLNYYNLACLLSKMGKLKEANKIFNKILTDLDPELTECYFLMAINYGLMEELEKTETNLQKYLELSPDGELAFEASELLTVLQDNNQEDFIEELNYIESDTYLSDIRETNIEDLVEQFNNDLYFRKLMFAALYQINDEHKEDVIRFYGLIADKKSEKVLRDYIMNPWIKERFRQLALLELKKIGTSEPYKVYIDGEIKEVKVKTFSLKAAEWRGEWQEVIDCALENMRRSGTYDESFYEDIQAIWVDYINNVYPDIPKVVKPETWAAALEYSLARFHFLRLTQKELAKNYDVSASTISQKFNKINNILKIDQKAYKNMLSYLQNLSED